MDEEFFCLRKIIQVGKKKVGHKVPEILTAFKNIIARPSLNFEILSKILLIFTDLLNYENDIIWNYLILGLDLMIKLIEECLIRQKSVMMTKINFEEFKIYIHLNDCIIEFVEEILHKISFEKKELKDSCEKYIEIVLKLFNIRFRFNDKTYRRMPNKTKKCYDD